MGGRSRRPGSDETSPTQGLPVREPFVLALDGEVRPLAEIYARITDRKCVGVDAVPELFSGLRRRQEQPVLVIASAAGLTFHMLCRLKECFGNAWSVLCGRGPAGADLYLIAKQLVASLHPGRFIPPLLSMSYRQIFSAIKGASPLRSSTPVEPLTHLLRAIG